MIGELVWISTRTRPDLAFTIAKLASLITKDPQQVIELTKHVWYYLVNTIDHGLKFQNPEDEKQLSIYTDASFNKFAWGATWSCGGRRCCFGRLENSQWSQPLLQKQSWWKSWKGP